MCREYWAGILYTPQYLAYEVMETSAGPLWKCFSDILAEVYIYLPGFNLKGVSSLPPDMGVQKLPQCLGPYPPEGRQEGWHTLYNTLHPCLADTEPLTTRHPRRDDLTFVERKLSVSLFHFLPSPLFTI